jgi:hypothetical protein
MIITIAIYIISGLVGSIALLFPDFQVYPASVFEGIHFFINTFLELNSLFLIIPIILTALVFFCKFLVYFMLYKLSIKLLNYFRGAGDGLG